MNILLPDSWLREYLVTDATPKQIKDCLSLCGPSVERVNRVNTDFIYEIEITSNRVDIASVYGIAREAAAILPRFGIKANLKQLATKTSRMVAPIKSGDSSEVQESKKLQMEVSDPQKICNRIMGMAMEVDPMKPSPDYVRDRLEKSGVRSLNNLVDITNYVMLEVGHPCHVFDYDRIKTHKFLLRFAKRNEPIITLDNKKYFLSSEDVIIDDGTGRVIDLPGIMGTENSVVNENTRRIFFFIESNNPMLIRKASMRYGIRTMAAAINEKHPDPELVETALFRGIQLYEQIAGAKVAGKIIDLYPHKSKPVPINTTIQFINERLGISLKSKEIIDILETLSFKVILSEVKNPAKRSLRSLDPSVKPHDDNLIITPPSFRQFDAAIPEDIVEEVARIYGYHNLPNKLMSGEIPVTDKPIILDVEKKIKNILKYWVHTEVYNYSFISKELIEKANLKISDHLKVTNPLTADTEYMRISLIPSMLETVAKNQFYSDNLQLFELANVYIPSKAVKTPGRWPKDSFQVEELESDLPLELSMLTITNQSDFYQLKGTIEGLLEELGVTDYHGVIPSKTRNLDHQAGLNNLFHPQQVLKLENTGRTLVTLGKIHPTIFQNFQLKNDLFLAVLNVELLSNLAKPLKHYTSISSYPAIVEDMTLTFPPKKYIGAAISEIYKINKLVKNVEMVDRYQNSTTLRITYHDENKNLESADVQKVRSQLLQTLKSKYNISLKL